MNLVKSFCKSYLHDSQLVSHNGEGVSYYVRAIFNRIGFQSILHSMSKEKEKRLARILYVDQGKTAKEVASIIEVTEKTIGTWVDRFGWKAIRQAKANSPDMMIVGIKELLKNLAEERLSLDSDSSLDEKTRAKRKATLADEASKWTKALEAAQNENLIPLGTYLRVMDSVFDAIRDTHPKIYLQLVEFQEQHIHKISSQYQ